MKGKWEKSRSRTTKICVYSVPNTGSRIRARKLNSVRERTWLGHTLLFEIFQAFLGGGIAQISSAAIPGGGLSGVAQSAANNSPAEEIWVESRPQP